MNSNKVLSVRAQNVDSAFLILLGLFSFGGAKGRFFWGLGAFDILLLIAILRVITRKQQTIFLVQKSEFIILLIYLCIILYGLLRYFVLPANVPYDYFITEFRFFVYFPLIFFIATNLYFRLTFFEKTLPYLLFIYTAIWAFFLNTGGFVYDFFNGEMVFAIGNHQRISGPPVLILVPLMLLLVREKNISKLLLLFYVALLLVIFIKSGERTYFIYYLFPLFYLAYKNRRKVGFTLLTLLLVLAAILVLKQITSTVFFERFTNVANVTEDSSFMYRVYNIFEMIGELNFSSFLLGKGIGSNYDVVIWYLHESYFLDNSFMTIIYKIGIIGLFIFISVFFIDKSAIPSDLYCFELLSLFLIATISYHIILNPVFIFGYFIIFSYYRPIRSNQVNIPNCS